MKLIIPSALAAALVSTANGQRGCRTWTASSASTTRGTNIVNEIWEASGKDCGYAGRQFEGDVKRALDAEFPNNCSDNGVFDAHRNGVQAGINWMNHIKKGCSQPVPRPTRPPQNGRCSRGNTDYEQGVRITKNLKISCAFVYQGDIEIQKQLAKKINANNKCISRGAYAEYDKIKRDCGKSGKEKVLEME